MREREREREREIRGVPCMISLLDQGGQVNLIFSETEDMGCRKPFHIWNSFFSYISYINIEVFFLLPVFKQKCIKVMNSYIS